MDDKWKPIDTMTKAELVEEVEKYRALWSWMHEDVRWILQRVGKTVRVITRSNVERLGVMLEPKFELKELEVGITEKKYDPSVGEYFWERKIVLIPASGIAGFEVIDDRKVFAELDEADLSALHLEVESEVLTE